ncbi:MAG: UvrB/UvrC motif-containing protein [bacterium]|nr:UvrB/UvrC motif-containing protein [bacterium]
MEKFCYLPKTKLSTLPKAPGVYTLASPKTVLYIGKAGNIKERVKNHFLRQSYRDNLFIEEVTRVGYIKTDSDIDALLLESQLIKKQQPKYNVVWKDDKKYFYVAIDHIGCTVGNIKLPRIFLTHQPIMKSPSATPGKPSDAVLSHMAKKVGFPPKAKQFAFGPFVEGKAIKRVLRLLRKVFPYYTTKKHGALPCQYCHLNLCPGPAPNEKTYRKNLRKLSLVLKGKKTSVLKKLEKEMKGAAKNQDFEKAGVLRDQFLSLERIISHARLLGPEISNSPDWNTIEQALQKLFSTKKRILLLEAYDISNIQGKEATGSQVTFLKGVPLKESYRKYKIRWPGEVSRLAVPSAHRSQRNFPREAKQLASRPNDFAMMQELISRRLSHPEWPFPQVMVIDGGKGQLSSALKAISNLLSVSYPRPAGRGSPPLEAAHLTESKLRGINVVALAKKQNELFFPDKPKSVLLHDLSRPLENLFLHIRDEAHRFAIKYHRHLHSKKVMKT